MTRKPSTIAMHRKGNKSLQDLSKLNSQISMSLENSNRNMSRIGGDRNAIDSVFKHSKKYYSGLESSFEQFSLYD